MLKKNFFLCFVLVKIPRRNLITETDKELESQYVGQENLCLKTGAAKSRIKIKSTGQEVMVHTFYPRLV